jgi:hypothetical protein
MLIFSYLYALTKSPMTELRLYTEFSTLPTERQKEVQDFIEFLKTKARKQRPSKQREFGAAIGFFKMQADFDQPLDDFKEYM